MKSVFRVFLEFCCSALTGMLNPADDIYPTNSKTYL